MLPPCGDCPMKGCGEYHDECEKFQEYRDKVKQIRQNEYLHMVSNLRPVNPYLKKKQKEKKR